MGIRIQTLAAAGGLALACWAVLMGLAKQVPELLRHLAGVWG